MAVALPHGRGGINHQQVQLARSTNVAASCQARPPMPLGALIVVPTFNEAENLVRLTALVRRWLPAADILIVDDASTDGTGALADALAQTDSQVRVLHRPTKLGIGSAYVAAFLWALERGYQSVVEMDADFSHDPKYLPDFMRALDAGADLAVGSRYVPGGRVDGWGIGRHALSRGGSLYSRLVLGVSVRDMTTGFKAYTRRALERLDISGMRSNGYAFQIETTYRALRRGLRVVEIPIVFVDRRAGSSKMTYKEVLEAVVSTWLMRGVDTRSKPG
jgi:dolichol-phosphate mannosyltransferase